MPKYIKPFQPPRLAQPSANTNQTGFRLDGSELAMFDQFAQEPINAAGTQCDVFQRDLKGSTIDALYGEPVNNKFIGPYQVFAQIEWPEFTPEASEDGGRSLWPSGMWIPRKTVEEAGARAPREGDVVRFWKLPYFDQRANGNMAVPNGGFYFDIIKVNDDGHLIDDANFVGFRCDLKRRSEFGPENLFTPPKLPNDPC